VNIVTVNSYLLACQRRNLLRPALELYESLPSEHPRVRPDLRTFTALISTAVPPATNNPDVAFSLFDALQSPPHSLAPNTYAYCALISSAGKCGRPDLSLSALRLTAGLPPDLLTGPWTAAISSLARAGRANTAVLLWRAMRRRGIPPSRVTLACVFELLVGEGRGGEAVEVLGLVKENGGEVSEHM
jgi:pentatricopeptide repeat protein